MGAWAWLADRTVGKIRLPGIEADKDVAKLLASIPVFETWQNNPLPPDLLARLREADRQTLISLAATVLLRIQQTQPDDSNEAIDI